MRAVDYVTNGFGIDPRVMPVPDPRSVPVLAPPAPMFTEMGYLWSPSGGGLGVGSGRRVYSLQDRFGDLVSRLVPYGLNPRFLDIVRGAGGRGFLVQTIRLVNAYRANLQRYKYNINAANINAAYNNSVAIAGGESFLMPRSFLTNPALMPDVADGDLSRWLSSVLSAL